MDIDEGIFLVVKVYNQLNENFELISGLHSTTLALDMSTVRLSSCDNRVHFSVLCPQELGIFAAVISEAHISCFAEKFNGAIWVCVSLSYGHPGGGRNGSEIGQFWIDETNETITAVTRPGQQAIILKQEV